LGRRLGAEDWPRRLRVTGSPCRDAVATVAAPIACALFPRRTLLGSTPNRAAILRTLSPVSLWALRAARIRPSSSTMPAPATQKPAPRQLVHEAPDECHCAATWLKCSVNSTMMFCQQAALLPSTKSRQLRLDHPTVPRVIGPLKRDREFPIWIPLPRCLRCPTLIPSQLQ
jgi:hypothetical protein